MAPTTKPERPILDYLGNPLHVGDAVTFIGTGLNDRPRLFKGTIAVLNGTEMCLTSSSLYLVKGGEFNNPDRIIYQGIALLAQPNGDG